MKNWIWLLIITLLAIILCIGKYNYNKLEKEYNVYKSKEELYIQKIDSLNIYNLEISNKINIYTQEIEKLSKEINNLEHDKSLLETKINNFTPSKNLSENVNLLRKNI